MASCEELVEAIVPGFADIAVVEVIDAALRGEEPLPHPLGRGPASASAAGSVP
ncbi:hypothetical protein [Streptomyces sp900116325]|uniref:Uncharacterized protein n=1 Tax=Streptomyces sp. 900116325 TaxID=3154295 RepID=A0ABV2UCD2_9ACTN